MALSFQKYRLQGINLKFRGYSFVRQKCLTKIYNMKTKSFLLLVLVIFSVLTSLVSCNRNESDDQPSNPQPAAAGFTWRENSATGILKTAGSSEVRTQYNSIFAFQGSSATSGTLFEINLTAVTPGTYAIGSSNAFYFSGGTGNPTSGNVVISSNANGKASGTFEAYYGSGNITAVYGTFTDIPVN